jgi:hypothetical protein
VCVCVCVYKINIGHLVDVIREVFDT